MRLSRRHALVGALLVGAWPRDGRAEDVALGSDAEDVKARWLAGLAPLAAGSTTPEWMAYRDGENDRWQKSLPRVTAMTDWSARELTPLLPKDYSVFYPFAGADALHAIALFGGARRVVLMGLEPVGVMPDPARPPAGFFARLGAAQADVHLLTFFRTREMSSDYQREGVVATLVATIARMGGKVARVQVLREENGSSVPTARIDWTSTDGASRRLEYLQADLANASLKARPQLAQAVRALGPCVTFVKAAMYLVAEARFSTLRQTLLEESAVVVQDDTGVPFRSFDERWAMRFFGRYEAPLPPFEDRVQPKLGEAFERRSTRPLPFGIGYRVQAQRSNLLVAAKTGR